MLFKRPYQKDFTINTGKAQQVRALPRQKNLTGQAKKTIPFGGMAFRLFYFIIC